MLPLKTLKGLSVVTLVCVLCLVMVVGGVRCSKAAEQKFSFIAKRLRITDIIPINSVYDHDYGNRNCSNYVIPPV